MTRHWLKGRLPNTDALRKQLGIHPPGQPVQGWMATQLSRPQLWHMNRRSVAGGVAVGLFISWMPLPLQMLIAAITAAVLRVHVPVSVVMVWFTNPLTFAPLLYVAWRVGSIITGTPPLDTPLTLTFDGLQTALLHAWPALAAGSLFCACITAILGFAATNIIWRISAVRRWRQRARTL
ncbi:MAG: DUF2062 domain-containing protein [Granulosicoccus sp.]